MRNFLRVLGPIVALAGLGFLISGVVSFFGTFGSAGQSGPPEKFWMVFLGMPLLFLGIVMTQWGYMGSIARYASKQITPVAAESIHVIHKAIQGQAGLRCDSCQAENDAGAKFCKGCGKAFPSDQPCRKCGRESDPNAKFCDGCGTRLI